MKLLQVAVRLRGDWRLLCGLRVSADGGLWLWKRRFGHECKSRVLLVATGLCLHLQGFSSFGGFGYWRRYAWSRDYPKADRQFLIAMQRYSNRRRSTEQVVTLDSDEIFDYPWIYAVQVQMWSFTDEEAKPYGNTC